MLAEEGAYTDNEAIKSVYDIAASARIGFNISEEIYFEEYLKYIDGKMNVDEFIKETDRRLAAYLNE